jgi:hypothetical protein
MEQEYEGLFFVWNPFMLPHSASGQLVGAERMFQTQHEQTPE